MTESSLSFERIKAQLTPLQLGLIDVNFYKELIDSLQALLSDTQLELNNFDAFEFAWDHLSLFERATMLAVAYRHHKAIFAGIRPEMPLAEFTLSQRDCLLQEYENLLSTVVSLFASVDLSDKFYSGYAPARRAALKQQKD